MSGTLKQEKDTAKQTNHFHTQTLFHSPIHLLSFLCSLVFSLKNKSHLNQIWGTPHLVHIHFPVTIKLVIFLVAHLCSYCCFCYSLFVWLRYLFKYEKAYSCMGKERRGSKRSCSRGKIMIKCILKINSFLTYM